MQDGEIIPIALIGPRYVDHVLAFSFHARGARSIAKCLSIGRVLSPRETGVEQAEGQFRGRYEISKEMENSQVVMAILTITGDRGHDVVDGLK